MVSLVALLRDPSIAPRLTVAEWSELLPRLKASGMLAHFGELLTLHQVETGAMPPAVQRQLAAAASTAWVRARSARWECGELVRLFANSGIPLVLLKGAGYLMTDALPGRGRFLDDVDILVPREAIPEVQRRLLESGWVNDTPDESEAAYYNEWLHQVPAFRHAVRHSMIDVHHTVIAPWGGHRVAVDPIFAQAVPIASGPLFVPSLPDQCLIVAAHFVRSDPSGSAFRDLLDLDELIRAGASGSEGQAALVARAREIGLERALGTASHFAAALFGTPSFGPRPVALKTRAAALIPDGSTRRSTFTAVLRGAHHVSALRAGLPWRVMFERTIRRRLGLKEKQGE